MFEKLFNSKTVPDYKIYEDVKGALSQLGGALKVGAEHVYMVLVKQQIVNSATNIIVYIFFLGLGGALILAGRRVQINAYRKGERADDDLLAWLYIPGITITIIGVVYFLWTIQSTVTGVVNPEYGAIEKIMDIIQG